MALKNAKRIFVKRFSGHNSFQDAEDLGPEWWRDSLNVIVGPSGNAEVMRSPLQFIDLGTSGNTVNSISPFNTTGVHATVFDTDNGDTYAIPDGGASSLIRSGEAGDPWVSLMNNDRLYRLDGNEFVQLQGDLTSFYKVGITAPAAAPTISYVAGGSGSIASSIFLTYAYYNSDTGHVSIPSPTSNTLNASGGSNTLRIPVVASAEDGVDKIVIFATEDGGSIPFLVVDASGDVQLFDNTTGNIDISIANLHWDTQVPETVHNYPAPINATSMFRWKDKLFLCGFPSPNQSRIVYSGFENIHMGVPWESWPLFNALNIPNKSEAAQGGIETQLGALIFTDLNAYLLSGYPSDKVSGRDASVAVTDHLEQLGWGIGTQSPKTIVNTPYGTMWLDQHLDVRLWNGNGFPDVISVPLRTKLNDIFAAEKPSAQAVWYQHGKFGGFYILTARISSSGANNRIFVISVFQDPTTGELRYGYGLSDFAAESIAKTLTLTNTERVLIGGLDVVKVLLRSDVGGSGWPVDTEIFFEVVLGNDENFQTYRSMRVDGIDENTVGTLTVTIANPDGTDEQAVTLVADATTGGSYYGFLHMAYGRRKILKFSFSSDLVDDTDLRQIKNLQVFYNISKRDI